jgi:DNA-binding transcriptional LysR family regulator
MSAVSVAAPPGRENGSVDSGWVTPPARWLAIRAQHLLTLEAVARAGSFSGAARALGYSQSAVSQQIAAVEGVARLQLIARGERVAPTPAGDVVLRRARAIRHQLAALDSELLALETGRSDGVCILAHHPAATSFLADVVHPAACDTGHALVVRTERSGTALVHALESGAGDLAVAVLAPVVDAEIVVEPLFETPLELVSLRTHAPSEEASLDQLSGAKLLCLVTCPATERLLRELQAREITHEVVVRADDPGTLLHLVRRGPGTAILPRACVSHGERDLVPTDLGERFAVGVSVVWCAERPPAGSARAMLELARETARRWRRRGA